MTQTQRHIIARTINELVIAAHVYGYQLALANETANIEAIHDLYNSRVNPLWKQLNDVLNEMEKEGK